MGGTLAGGWSQVEREEGFWVVVDGGSPLSQGTVMEPI